AGAVRDLGAQLEHVGLARGGIEGLLRGDLAAADAAGPDAAEVGLRGQLELVGREVVIGIAEVLVALPLAVDHGLSGQVGEGLEVHGQVAERVDVAAAAGAELVVAQQAEAGEVGAPAAAARGATTDGAAGTAAVDLELPEREAVRGAALRAVHA